MVGWIFFFFIVLHMIWSEIVYLKIYWRLRRHGIKATGKVVSYRTDDYHLMWKGTKTPVILITDNGSDVGQRTIPVRPYFIRMVSDKLKDYYNIIYDKDNPAISVLDAKNHLYISLSTIAFGLTYSGWFFLTFAKWFLIKFGT